MAKSPEEYAHLEWLGYVQPIGLIVSVPAMLEAQCYINKNIIGEHARFLDCLPRGKNDEIVPEITDFAAFAQKCLEWEAEDLKEIPQRVPLTEELSSLEVILPQYHETLRPTHVVLNFQPPGNQSPNKTTASGDSDDDDSSDDKSNNSQASNQNAEKYLMLIQVLPPGTDFDEPSESDSSRHWHASPQLKFERLLRESHMPIGLLSSGKQLRLIYAPRGESSGHATFNVDEMVQVAGRPMFAALHMLLSGDRMFTLGEKQRLPAILINSRKYQNTVSTKLAEQVLAALYELIRGFQSANDVRKGELLKQVLADDPNQVYSGLLRVLMRLVFVLYAEDRDLMSGDAVYSNNYSVTGLFDRLRSDKGRFPDTMDSRFGAWSQLLTLFRLVYEGGQHATFKLPPRKGYLFDPDRYPFLEGRTASCTADEAAPVPRISDGVVYRVLRNLLILDGERLSYRTLDVEQIGSVYETIMGFNLEVAHGQAIAIKPVKSHGAPATINLDELLETPGKDRAKWIKEQTDQKITGQALKDLKEAESIDDLLTALDKKIAKMVTPRVVLAGSIVLQPSDERRRSGSHYTPRSLTKPIVETTLQPILKQLVEPPKEEADGEKTLFASKGRKTKLQAVKSERDEEAARLAQEKGSPHPRQILNLKVCDPAMGSGAFLVETCRQLGDELVAAWYAHECVPTEDIPPDEDEVLYARRLIAQRCLYGVDKNSMAVDLSKLSLWLVTLAKDHPFTFLDHSLRHGDSLVGLTADQISNFTWDLNPSKKSRSYGLTFKSSVQARLEKATEHRRRILDAREDTPYRDQEKRMRDVDEQLDFVRVVGDACVSAFFSEAKQKAREERRGEQFNSLADWISNDITSQFGKPLIEAAKRLRTGDHSVPPFHWEIEFPEVFGREHCGFDGFVGNPPFIGVTSLAETTHPSYTDWLREAFPNSGGKTDAVAFFFRQVFSKLAQGRTLGLIATNTIAQGDTRRSGLLQLVRLGGTIYSARSRVRWPGAAAVIVSVIHILKGEHNSVCLLDGRRVSRISAFLLASEQDEDPKCLRASKHIGFLGSKVQGIGFVVNDENTSCPPNDLIDDVLEKEPQSRPLVKGYIGGEDLNAVPIPTYPRRVIDFGSMNEEEVHRHPLLLEIVRQYVWPARKSKTGTLRTKWWQFGHRANEMYEAILGLDRVLTVARVSRTLGFTFMPTGGIINDKIIVFRFDSYSSLCVFQSRVHEAWARTFSSTLKDDLQYTPSDCLVTFPLPIRFDGDSTLEDAGEKFFKARERLMVERECGVTQLSHLFNNPDSTDVDIENLRTLQHEMDRVVLRKYGWEQLAENATCEFLLDYEEEENDDPKARKSTKKKPWRYRWPDDFGDDVLARLLALNEERATSEQIDGTTAKRIGD